MTTIEELIVRPLTVYGRNVTAQEIRRAIGIILQLDRFVSMDALGAFYGGDLENADKPVWSKQEAMNRLMQRFRKMDLVEFTRGYWRVKSHARKILSAA